MDECGVVLLVVLSLSQCVLVAWHCQLLRIGEPPRCGEGIRLVNGCFFDSVGVCTTDGAVSGWQPFLFLGLVNCFLWLTILLASKSRSMWGASVLVKIIFSVIFLVSNSSKYCYPRGDCFLVDVGCGEPPRVTLMLTILHILLDFMVVSFLVITKFWN